MICMVALSGVGVCDEFGPASWARTDGGSVVDVRFKLRLTHDEYQEHVSFVIDVHKTSYTGRPGLLVA